MQVSDFSDFSIATFLKLFKTDFNVDLYMLSAAKLALNMFSHEKSTTPRERDLVRILKVQRSLKLVIFFMYTCISKIGSTCRMD